MAITSTTNKVTYTGNATASVFPYAFKIFANTELEVDQILISTEAVTRLALTTDYTVSGVDSSTGGNVTLVAGALSALYKLTIRRVLPLTQLVDFIENDSAPAETFEESYDRDTMIAQQLQETLDRCIKMKVYTSGVTVEIPDPQAGYYLGWNSTATALENKIAISLGDADLDTDGTLAANSDTRVASQKAAKTYVDTTIFDSHYWTDGTGNLYPATANDNVTIGGTTDAGTSGQGVLVLKANASPTTSPVDVVQLYSEVMSQTITATGGTKTTEGAYTVHTFLSNADFIVTAGGNVEYLVVGGGASGGGCDNNNGFNSAGGGAGGYLINTGHAVTAKTYSITVGAGGAASAGKGNNGTDSIFDTITATGGGGGGEGIAGGTTSEANGADGGSGGGGGGTAGGGTPTGGNGTVGQGNDAQDGTDDNSGWASGGGGSGATGGAAAAADSAGGVGTANSFSGSAVTYAAGGVGAPTTPAAGAANTGDGGDGATKATIENSMAGGSGIVIIRYLTSPSAAAELKVRDEVGNVTTLSPHNFKDIPKAKIATLKTDSNDLAWTYHSEKDGKSITVDMFSLAQAMEKMTGQKFIYSNIEIENKNEVKAISEITTDIKELTKLT